MNCTEARKGMPDLLQDGLAGAEAARLREHLGACPACWQEWQELNETWAQLGLIAEEQPGPGLRRRFYRSLEEWRREAEPSARPWRARLRLLLPDPRRLAPAMGLAAAALVLIVGFGAGFFLGRGGDADRLEQLSRENGRLRQQASLSLLEQPSAAARLQGVSLAARQPDPGGELIRKLLDILDNDPSVNVRLQAVDALYMFVGREEVRSALSASLERQTSPMVQVALIDLIVAAKERRAAAALRELLQSEKAVPEVKQRAQSGIERIL